MTGPTNLKPRCFSSLEMVSESGVLAGTGPVFWIGLPPARSQAKGAKSGPGILHLQKDARAVDGGFDLGAGADDAWVFH